MIARSCPGARLVQEPRPEYLRCAHCGRECEIWTDEYRVRCPHCNTWTYRGQGATCLDWCAKAEECVGTLALVKYRRARRHEGE